MLPRTSLLAAALIAGALLIRLILVLQGWPELNSDEATMGLMARHIALHGEHPAFFYGQSYMGSIEAYGAAPLFRLFGDSTMALRLPSVLLFGVFLGLMYALGRLLYGPPVAVITLAVLAVGPEELLFRQIEVVGGYQEALVLAAALMLIASSLACGTGEDRPRLRLSLMALWGLCAGVGVWSDGLILPFVLSSGALLLVRRVLRSGRSLAITAAAFLVGLAPLLLHDIANPQHSAVGSMVRVFVAGGSGNSHVSTSLGERVAGTLAVSLPLVTGARPVCALPPATAWPITGTLNSHAALCTGVHIFWSGVFLALGGIALISALVAFARSRELGRFPPAVATVALLVASALTIVLYVASSAPALDPRFTARYLSLLPVAIPAVVAPFVTTRRFLAAGGMFLLAFYGIVLVMGTVNTFQAVPSVRAKNRAQEALVSALLHRGVTRVYTDYATCDRLAFQSHERIVCAVLNDRLGGGQDRYPLYRSEVAAHPRALYLFPSDAPQITALRRRNHRGYRWTGLYGYMLAQPFGPT